MKTPFGHRTVVMLCQFVLLGIPNAGAEESTSSVRPGFEAGDEIQLQGDATLEEVKSETIKVPTFELKSANGKGSVRAKILKRARDGEKFKYFFKTKAATLGVRGTEFGIEALGSDEFKFQTFEGQVEVASTDEALLAGKGTPVSAGESVIANPTTGLGPVTGAAGAAATAASGAPPPASAIGGVGGILSMFSLVSFEAGYTRFQTDFTSLDTQGMSAAWTPEFKALPDFLHLKFHLGLASLKSPNGEGFAGLEAGARVVFRPFSFPILEVGYLQNSAFTPARPGWDARIGVPMSFLPLLHHLYLGYQPLREFTALRVGLSFAL